MSIENLLHDEIVSELEELSKIKVGTDEYEKSVNGITKLVDRAIEMDKVNIDVEEKAKNRELDEQLTRQQMADEKEDRYVKNGITAVSVIGGLGVTVWGALKSWEFEKEGTVTSAMGRMFMNCLRPKK